METGLDYKAIGSRIRKSRLDRNMSQEKLAEQCEISASFLGHIERGTRKMSLETLVRLSKILNTSIDYLLVDQTASPGLAVSQILSEAEARLSKEQYKKLENAIKALITSAELL
ncbi:MAG: helix-turn-helix transcriptional regulator [Bacillota bacterium]|nr:helix-turn-helix transcriptional regulator [Bacillota bacterium]